MKAPRLARRRSGSSRRSDRGGHRLARKVTTVGVGSAILFGGFWADGYQTPPTFDYARHQVLGLATPGVDWVRARVDPFDSAEATAPADRAKSAWAAAERHMALPLAPGVYRNDSRGVQLASVWTQGQVISAALDLAPLTQDRADAEEAFAALKNYDFHGAYAAGIFRPPFSHRLWDDNLWVAQDFIDGYVQTGDRSYLDRAAGLYPFLLEGRHAEGGLYWKEDQPRMTRNAVSNLPAVEYGLRMYRFTGEAKYLTLAKECQAFVDANLRSPEGLIWDNLADDGGLDRAIYSYNQGTAVQADVLWFQLTGDETYRARARATAQASLDHFEKNDRLWKHPPVFNAIYFRNLLALEEIDPDPRYRKALDGYLERAWTEARDPSTGLFERGGIGSYHAPKMQLIDQAGFAQMYALQAKGPAARTS